MPELPEVETTLRGIAPFIKGKRLKDCVIRNPNLRWPVPENLPKTLIGQKLTDIQRRGKFLICRFENDVCLIHLGMSGHLSLNQKPDCWQKHDHWQWDFGTYRLKYNDPRRFGCLVWSQSHQSFIDQLGPEPLSEHFNSDYLYKRLRTMHQSIKLAIMRQDIVVGMGNIYANESLFKSGIHPQTHSHLLTRKKCTLLVEAIKQTLNDAIQQGGTSLRDFVDPQGQLGYFGHTLFVYNRADQPCTICQCPIKKIIMAQRATYYCSKCQKLKWPTTV